jgi:hypothetical protein
VTVQWVNVYKAFRTVVDPRTWVDHLTLVGHPLSTAAYRSSTKSHEWECCAVGGRKCLS